MYVVMAASECAPVAQAGGLGEVVFGLSREVAIRGHHVEVVMPKYDSMRYDLIDNLQVSYSGLEVPWDGGSVWCTVWSGEVQGRHCFFIEPHSHEAFFERGHLYGSPDDIRRFAFFSKATLEFLLRSGRRPDVIHCHDWQTALIPVLLYEIYQHVGMLNQRVCFTVHNFAHQGVTGEAVLYDTGLMRPDHFFDDDRLRDNFNHSAINLMKGGIIYSNAVTTVSPHHAWEARFTEQGAGLARTLSTHQHKFSGVLNGVDYDVWNPEIDHLIPSRYAAESVDRKYDNKRALRDRLLLRQTLQPVISYVGRLDRQKGVHLIRRALHYALDHGAQFVLLGTSPEPVIQREFLELKARLNDNPDCHLELSFSTELAHLIYAGSDLVIVPSLFEPCGLAQLIALKYGTVPVVRHIGGLVDTVHDREYSDRPAHERTGFVFHQPDDQAIDSALGRAIGLWYDFPGEFRQLMLQGMARDHSWARSGDEYIRIYDQIRHK